MAETRTESLRMSNILKQYGITTAVNHVNFSAAKGEVIGLIGANGAGKSTLMGVLTGTVPATEGSIEIEGKQVDTGHYNATEAMNAGVAAAFQELSLCQNLQVYENFAISLLRHEGAKKPGWRKRIADLTRECLDRCFPDNGIDVKSRVSSLSIEQQQMIEISRAAAMDNLKILVLDEPTSSLGNERINQLHETVNRLSSEGITIIYITHKLEEIIKITHHVVLMNNGEVRWKGDTSTVTIEDLINMMGGKQKDGQAQTSARQKELEELIGLDHYNAPGLHDITMRIGKGEIVGISGLGGSGQRELLNEIFSAVKKGGKKQLRVQGDASFVSGDRRKEGLFPLWSIADNIIISGMDQLTSHGLLDKNKCADMAQYWYDKLKFKAEGRDASIMSRSGGNQQKAIIGRGIASNADLIILDDPTRGVDANTKKEMYQVLREVCESGKSVLWYSTEDNEMEECDRVYVMNEGCIVEELKYEDVTVDNIIAASFKKAHAGNEKTSTAGKSTWNGKLLSFLQNPSLIAALILVFVWVMIGIYNPNTHTRMGMQMLIGNALPLVFIAMAQMFIILVGDINMGIGSALGLVNVLCATILVRNGFLGAGAAILFLLAYGAVAVLIHLRKMPSIVVSLGMQSIWLGIAITVQPTPGGKAPAWITSLLKAKTPLLPMPVYISIAAILAGWWIVCRSKYGIILRGIGNNPKAVEKHGWSYLKAHVTAYVISGCFTIIAGILLTGISLGSDANGASSYQMMSIATVLLGGCKFAGGIVEPVGVVLAAAAISLISSMLTFMGVNSNYQTAVIGIILLAALILGGFLQKGRSKK